MVFDLLYKLGSIHKGKGNSQSEIAQQEKLLGCRLPSFLRSFYSHIDKDHEAYSCGFPKKLAELIKDNKGFIEVYIEEQSGFRWAFHPERNENIYKKDEDHWIDQNTSIEEFFLYNIYSIISQLGLSGNQAWGIASSAELKKITEVLKIESVKLIFESKYPFKTSFYQVSENDLFAIDDQGIFATANNMENFESILSLLGDVWIRISRNNIFWHRYLD